MGAAIKLDLTSDVTHLIVGSIDSAKYRYVAKSREDVKVLLPAWLEALRQRWMAGDDHVDVEALEQEFRVPVFFRLKICLTGFDNPEQRRYIQEAVDANGAEYHGDLTKSVTHLIAATPSGKKYEHALNWHMKVVSLEWFQQSLERRMALDEAPFNPALPVEERGQGAWERTSSTPVTGKRARDANASQPLNPFRRKLRRSASTKLGGQSEALWAGITAASAERQQDDGDDWTEHSIAPQEDARAQTPASLPGGATTLDTVPSFASLADAPVSPSYGLAQGHASDGIFEGRIVCPHGFDKEKTGILRHHLNSHGARVLSANELNNASVNDLTRAFLVLPHDAEVDLAGIPERAGSLVWIASNWWVERCLHGKRLVNPAEDVLSRPFGKLSIGGFSALTIHSTGFAGIELLHVTKLVALMGATYDEHLTAQTSLIICNATGANSQKVKFAAEKRIPAVTSAWLSDCIRKSHLQSYEDYRFSTPAITQPRLAKPGSRASIDAPAHAALPYDNAKTRQSKLQYEQTKSKGRPRTLDLEPSANATSAPTNITDKSALDRDESSVPNVDGHASLPLQSIRTNSSRPPSTSSTSLKSHSRPRSSSADSLIRAAPASHDTKPLGREKQATDSVIATHSIDKSRSSVPPPPPPIASKEPAAADKDYSDILAQLRANRKTAPPSADQPDGQRRRRRQLGRAMSTRSNQSGTSSGNTNNHNISLDKDDEDDESALVEEYQPSQQLAWDEPGAAKAREVMIRKLGGTIKDKSVPVQGIGMVMDESGEGTGRHGRTRRG